MAAIVLLVSLGAAIVLACTLTLVPIGAFGLATILIDLSGSHHPALAMRRRSRRTTAGMA